MIPEDIELAHQRYLDIQSKLETIEKVAKIAIDYNSPHLLKTALHEIMILALEAQLLHKENKA